MVVILVSLRISKYLNNTNIRLLILFLDFDVVMKIVGAPGRVRDLVHVDNRLLRVGFIHSFSGAHTGSGSRR